MDDKSRCCVGRFCVLLFQKGEGSSPKRPAKVLSAIINNFIHIYSAAVVLLTRVTNMNR